MNQNKIFKEYLNKRPKEELSNAVRSNATIIGEKQCEEMVDALIKWCGARSWINGLTVKSLEFMTKEFDWGRKFGVAITAKVEQDKLTIKQIAYVFIDVAEQVTKKNDELNNEISGLNAHIDKFYDFCAKITNHEYEKSDTPEYIYNWDEDDYGYIDVYFCKICGHKKLGEGNV